MTEYSVLNPKTENEGYGIKVVSERHVYDISRSLSKITEFCDMCNSLMLDPVHFDSVLEDFLSEKEAFL